MFGLTSMDIVVFLVCVVLDIWLFPLLLLVTRFGFDIGTDIKRDIKRPSYHGEVRALLKTLFVVLAVRIFCRVCDGNLRIKEGSDSIGPFLKENGRVAWDAIEAVNRRSDGLETHLY